MLLDATSADWGVVGVLSDRPGVMALDRAEAAGVPSRVVAWSDFSDRAAFTSAVAAAAAEFAPDYIVLAGFMRVLGSEAIERFPNRIINLHPSLLPAFPGAHAVREAIEYGVKLSGVTVHFVDELLDHGPIIRQEAVEVLRGDDEATLHARIQEVEHRLLPEVVQALAVGSLGVAGRRVEGTVKA